VGVPLQDVAGLSMTNAPGRLAWGSTGLLLPAALVPSSPPFRNDASGCGRAPACWHLGRRLRRRGGRAGENGQVDQRARDALCPSHRPTDWGRASVLLTRALVGSPWRATTGEKRDFMSRSSRAPSIVLAGQILPVRTNPGTWVNMGALYPCTRLERAQSTRGYQLVRTAVQNGPRL